MSSSLAAQLITVAVLTLQRQLAYNQTASRTNWNSTYDFIVCGAGTAGVTVAYRLAEANFSVLLLESGNAPDVITDMPALASGLKTLDRIWTCYTQTQKYMGLGWKDGIVLQAQANIFGGATTIGRMLYSRGHRSTYDRWASVYGATGWDYDSLQPYFSRVERFIDPLTGQQTGNGSFRMRSRPVSPDTVLLLLQKAFNDQGLPTVNPLELGNQVGTAFYPIMADGRRTSTISTYLDPNPFPGRLHIVPRSMVQYATFEDCPLTQRTKAATGVVFQYRNSSPLHKVVARREVVLSTSAYGNYPLLFLSGVGPAELLTPMGVPVVVNTSMAFGRNTLDHPVVTMYYVVANESRLLNEQIGPTIQQLYDFYVLQQGPLTEYPHLAAYISVPNGDPMRDGNDQSQKSAPNGLITASVEVIPSNLTDLISRYDPYQAEKWRQYFEPVAGKRVLALSATLLQPYSLASGNIGMYTQYAKAYQVYNIDYLWDRRDRFVFTEILKKMFALTEGAGFARYAQPLPGPIPACERLYCYGVRPLSACTPYITCLIGQLGRSSLHQVGVTKMGGSDREDAVVDPRLRVKGLQKLRIVDGSVMPEIPNSGTMAAALMIGEKGAQMILDDHLGKEEGERR